MENVLALLRISEANLMRMPGEKVLAELSRRRLSESSMAIRVIAQVKGIPAMMAALLQGGDDS